jgi:hypothetical protein
MSACFTQPQDCRFTKVTMIASIAQRLILPRAVAVAPLMLGVALSLGLAGCASSVSEMGDNMTLAFVDPAKYDYYDCKQLETERKGIANKLDELRRLMAKAETGVGGAVVTELAYRNDYIAYRGQAKLAEETWRKNKCHDSPPAAPGDTSAAATPAAPAHAKGGRSSPNSGSAVY